MIYDISPVVSASTPVWPGDRSLTRHVHLEIAKGDPIVLSSLESTVHIGAHADAPSHFHKQGISIEQVDLEPYLGPCEVISVMQCPEILEQHCRAAVATGATRLLFHTESFSHQSIFQKQFCYFSEQAVRFMGQNGVKLIGIDTPSVDHFASKDLPAHHALHAFDMRNLEGLDLAGVPDGKYELIALPLRLQGFDASPVRAILRSI